MRHQCRAALGILTVVMSIVSLAPVRVTGQATTAGAKSSTPPRTAWGEPDLQGVWDYDVSTPLERPKELAGKEFLTEAEAVEFQKMAEAIASRDNPEEDPVRADPTAEIRPYNRFWIESGTAGVVATRRTSLIIDPKDGRVPPLTPEAQKRHRAEKQATSGVGRHDVPPGGWIDDLSGGKESGMQAEVRCLVGINAGPPMLPCCYNNHIQVFQSPAPSSTVAIVNEMIHTARVIPLDGRPHVNQEVRQWTGDSRGRWEGQTLVIETTNFHPNQGSNRLFRQIDVPTLSANMRVIERFTRTDADTLLYEFTIEDPTVWTRPWTAQIPMRKTQDKMYEYACHEGNHSLYGILSGARAREGH